MLPRTKSVPGVLQQHNQTSTQKNHGQVKKKKTSDNQEMSACLFYIFLPFLSKQAGALKEHVEVSTARLSPHHGPSIQLTDINDRGKLQFSRDTKEKCSLLCLRTLQITTPKHRQTPCFNRSKSSTGLSISSHQLLLFIQLRGESVRVTDSFHFALAETLGNQAFLQHYKHWLLWGDKQENVRRQTNAFLLIPLPVLIPQIQRNCGSDWKRVGLSNLHCVTAPPQKCAALRDFFFLSFTISKSINYYLET